MLPLTWHPRLAERGDIPAFPLSTCWGGCAFTCLSSVSAMLWMVASLSFSFDMEEMVFESKVEALAVGVYHEIGLG